MLWNFIFTVQFRRMVVWCVSDVPLSKALAARKKETIQVETQVHVRETLKCDIESMGSVQIE